MTGLHSMIEKLREEDFERVMLPANNRGAMIKVEATTPKNRPTPQVPPGSLALGAKIAKKLRFRENAPSRQLHGLQSGHLSDPLLAEAGLATIQRGYKPAIWSRREIMGAPRIYLQGMVDGSGSMAHGRIDAARETIYAIGAGVERHNKAFPGAIDFTCYVHHCSTGSVEIDRILHGTVRDLRRVAMIGAHGGTMDGTALHWGIDRALADGGDRQKIILFPQDGTPADGELVVAEVARARKQGIAVIALFMGQVTASRATGMTYMYGPEGRGWYGVPDSSDLPGIVGKIVVKLTSWRA